jgi:putative peptidoglycan lipid II flippase
VLQATLFPVLLAHLSEDAARGDVARVRSTVARTAWVVAAGSTVIALAVFAIRAPLLRLLFLHGSMDAGGVTTMTAILPYHLLGLVPFVTLLVSTRAHVALRNGPIFVRLGLIGSVLNVAGNVALAPWLGLRGIALATSLTNAVLALISISALRARRG